MSTILEKESDLNIAQAQAVQDVFVGDNSQVVLPNEIVSRIGVKPNMVMKVLQVGDCLVLVNAAAYAIAKARAGMKGEAERLGLKTEDEVYEYINQLRHEGR